MSVLESELAPGRPEDAEGPEPGGPRAEARAVPRSYPVSHASRLSSASGALHPGLPRCGPLPQAASPSPWRCVCKFGVRRLAGGSGRAKLGEVSAGARGRGGAAGAGFGAPRRGADGAAWECAREGLARRRRGCVCVWGVGDQVNKCMWRQV